MDNIKQTSLKEALYKFFSRPFYIINHNLPYSATRRSCKIIDSTVNVTNNSSLSKIDRLSEGFNLKFIKTPTEMSSLLYLSFNEAFRSK